MKIKKSYSSGSAILVSSEDLRYSQDFLSRHFATIDYRVVCEDGTEFQPKDLEELLQYENPDFRRIRSISITAKGAGSASDVVRINIGRTGYLADVLSGFDIAVDDYALFDQTEKELISRLAELRAWYSWLTKIPFSFVVPLSLFAYAYGISLIGVVGKLTNWWKVVSAETKPSRFSESEQSVLVLLVIAVLVGLGILVDRWKRYLFPRIFFRIGKQVRAFDRRQSISKVVFGVIVLGILINIASSLIMR